MFNEDSISQKSCLHLNANSMSAEQLRAYGEALQQDDIGHKSSSSLSKLFHQNSAFNSLPQSQQDMLNGVELLKQAGLKVGFYQEHVAKASGTDITLRDWLCQWLKRYKVRKTHDGYESYCRLYIIPALGDYLLGDICLKIINGFFDNLPETLHPTSRSHIRATLHAALAAAVDTDLIALNPVARHHEPLRYNGKSIKILNPEELALLLSHQEIPFYDEIAVAVGTAVRQGELLAFRWCDCDLDSPQPSIRVIRSLDQKSKEIKDVKTNKTRRVRLFSPTVKVLKARRERNCSGPDDLIFCNLDGTPEDGTAITKSFSKSLKKLKIHHIRFQDIRHTVATHLLGGLFWDHKVWGIKAVQERLGHSTGKMTLDQYGHFMPGIQDTLIDAFEDRQQRLDPQTADKDGANGESRTRDRRFTNLLAPPDLLSHYHFLALRSKSNYAQW
jgi:integrase